jgi:hypothetical protein
VDIIKSWKDRHVPRLDFMLSCDRGIIGLLGITLPGPCSLALFMLSCSRGISWPCSHGHFCCISAERITLQTSKFYHNRSACAELKFGSVGDLVPP